MLPEEWFSSGLSNLEVPEGLECEYKVAGKI
jgi:hypothetical protein